MAVSFESAFIFIISLVIHNDLEGLSFVFSISGNYGSERISNLANIPKLTVAVIELHYCLVFMPLLLASPDFYLQLGPNKHSEV